MIFNHPHLICAFSRRPQNMSLVWGDTNNSLNNRKVFLKELNINYLDLVCAQQAHGSHVEYIKESDRGKGSLDYETALPQTDALITDKRNLPLAILTADCIPIFLYDPKTEGIGLIHAGWRNSQEEIFNKTLGLMRDKFKTKPEHLYVGFGPSIRGCCYKVGEEFSSIFADDIIKRNGYNYLDLVRVNTKKLLSWGVKKINIFDSGICTSCQNKEFFSYRREEKSCGRMISVIMLK